MPLLLFSFSCARVPFQPKEIELFELATAAQDRTAFIGHLADLMKIRVRRYRYKKGIPGHDGADIELGVLARELDEVRGAVICRIVFDGYRVLQCCVLA